MASWDDVRRLAMVLPEVTESAPDADTRGWQVRRKSFVWERPLRRGDLLALGDAAPRGPVLGAYVADLGVKQALVADGSSACFTTPHFDGYPAVLVRLDDVAVDDLAELVTDAWLARAPKRLAAALLADREAPGAVTARRARRTPGSGR